MSSVSQNVLHSSDSHHFGSVSYRNDHTHPHSNSNKKLIESLKVAIYQLNAFVVEPPVKYNVVDSVISKATNARNELVSFLSYLNSFSNASQTNVSEVYVNSSESTPRSPSPSTPSAFHNEYGSYSAPPPSQNIRPLHPDSLTAQSQPGDDDLGFGYYSSDMFSEYHHTNSHSEYLRDDSETYDTAMGVVAGILTPSASPAPPPPKVNQKTKPKSNPTHSPPSSKAAILSAQPRPYAKSESETLAKRRSKTNGQSASRPQKSVVETSEHNSPSRRLSGGKRQSDAADFSQPLPNQSRTSASYPRETPTAKHPSRNRQEEESQSTVQRESSNQHALDETLVSRTPPPQRTKGDRSLDDDSNSTLASASRRKLTPSPRHSKSLPFPNRQRAVNRSQRPQQPPLPPPPPPVSQLDSGSRPSPRPQATHGHSSNGHNVSREAALRLAMANMKGRPQRAASQSSSGGGSTDSPPRSCDTSENSATGSGSDSGSAELHESNRKARKEPTTSSHPSEQTPTWSALCGQKSLSPKRKIRTRAASDTTAKAKPSASVKTKPVKGQATTKPRRTQSASTTKANSTNSTAGTTPRRTTSTSSSSASPSSDAPRSRGKQNGKQSARSGSNRSSKRRGPDEALMRRVFVSNLPHDVADEQIRQTFRACGEIKHTVWFPSRTDGRFYGSGLITFKDNAGAANAVEWNKKTVLGRTIRVEYSACQDPIKEKPPGCSTTYLNNVPLDITEERIRAVFKHCGRIVRVRFHERDGERTGGAFVQFHDTHAADRALLMHGSIVDGFPLYVDYQRY